MNQGSNSANNDSAGPRRGVWMLLLYVAIVVCGVFAALQIRRFWLCPQEPAAPSRAADRTGALQTQAAGGPGEGIADPLAGTALRRLQGHPAQIPPPEGATLRSAFQRQALGRLEQQGRYDFAGRLDAVAEHYVRGLTRQGYKLLRNGRDVSGRRELLFAKDRRTVNLVLRKRKRQEKIVVEFTVTVSRPER